MSKTAAEVCSSDATKASFTTLNSLLEEMRTEPEYFALFVSYHAMAEAMKHEVPIIVGVGEFKNASKRCQDAIEPLHLMLKAIHAAADDALGPRKSDLIRDIDGISVVGSSTWPYSDLPALISQELEVNPKFTAYSGLLGNSPVQLLDDAARSIAQGQLQAAVIVGGEALASLKEFIKTGTFPPPWTGPAIALEDVYYANDLQTLTGIGKAHMVGVPMQVYAMYENGRRAHRGQTMAENRKESATLYAKFAKIAAKHPTSWNFGKEPETESSIETIDSRNRMICFPYPLLQNAFNDVNLAAACIVTSCEYAERAGIPRDKWIYPLGGGRASDSENFWDRPNFYSSPAIPRALSMSLVSSGLCSGDVDLFDFYSCFPIVPKLACECLGIPVDRPPKPITLLGGLTSFGGAGANYSMHAVAEMARQLRVKRRMSNKTSNGLILANGGVLTHENAICLSTNPRRDNTMYPQSDADSTDTRVLSAPFVAATSSGEAIIETYTVEYDRQNRPRLGHIVCRLKLGGSRVVANHADSMTLKQLSSCVEEQIGRSGFVRPSATRPGQNLFTFCRSRL